jgi:ribosomal protein S18 acetylase RimI-like enzyme
MSPVAPTVALRPATADDDAFLRLVYASTRETDLSVVPWNEATKEAFLAMQYDAQDGGWHRASPDAAYDVVLVSGLPVGRFYVNRGTRELSVIDMSLLAAHRGRGIGTALLAGLLREADEKGLPVGLHVERHNPARRLYERLGFEVVEDLGVHLRLVRPSQVNTAS